MAGGGSLARVWLPYCGAAPEPGALAERWNLDPVLLAGLALAVVAYRLAVPAARRRPRPFFAAMAVLVVLFVSPFCALTSALFAARSAHHALLVAVAAPLLAAACPGANRLLRLPLWGWTAVSILVLWAWHVPGFYAAALSSDAVYWLMQVTLLASATGFWAAVWRASPASAVGALLAAMVQMGLLGAILTFASVAFYAPHFLTTAAWGLSPLEDQQLAGLIMWAPAAALYLFAALYVAGRWLAVESAPAAR